MWCAVCVYVCVCVVGHHHGDHTSPGVAHECACVMLCLCLSCKAPALEITLAQVQLNSVLFMCMCFLGVLNSVLFYVNVLFGCECVSCV